MKATGAFFVYDANGRLVETAQDPRLLALMKLELNKEQILIVLGCLKYAYEHSHDSKGAESIKALTVVVIEQAQKLGVI